MSKRMNEKEKTDLALKLIQKAKDRHGSMPDAATGLITGVEERIGKGVPPSDGQMKYLRSLASSKGVDDDGKPSSWRGAWRV